MENICVERQRTHLLGQIALPPQTDSESETHAASLKSELFQSRQCGLVFSGKQALVASVVLGDARIVGACEAIAVIMLPRVAVRAANLGFVSWCEGRLRPR